MSSVETGLHALIEPLAVECEARLRAIASAQESLLSAIAQLDASLRLAAPPANAEQVQLDRRVLNATRTLNDAAARVKAVRERVDVVALRVALLERATQGDAQALSRSAQLAANVDGHVVQPVLSTVQPVVSSALTTASTVATKGRAVLAGLVHTASGIVSTASETAVRLSSQVVATASSPAKPSSSAAASSSSPAKPQSGAAPPLLQFDATSESWTTVARDQSAATTTAASSERRANWSVAQLDGAAIVGGEDSSVGKPDDAADIVLVWCTGTTTVQVVARLQQLEWCRSFAMLQHVFAVVLLRQPPHSVRVMAPSHSLVIQVDSSFAFVLVNAVPDDEWRTAVRALVANAVVCWPELKDAPQGQEVFGDNLPQLNVV